MTARRKFIFVSTCLLLAAVALPSALVNRQSIENINLQSQIARDSQVRLRAQLTTLEKQMVQAEAQLGKSSANPVVISAANSTGAASPNTGNQFAENPATVSLRRGFFRAQAQLSYSRFFQSVSLSPARSEAICDRIAGHEAWSQDHSNQWPRNVPPSDPRFVEFKKQWDEEGRKYEADLRALLGNEDSKAFSEFTSSQGIWQQVDNFASAVYATDTPLTADQSAQLAQVMKKHPPVSTGSSRSAFDADAVLQDAASFLSPLQFSILTKQLTAEKLWNAL